MSARSFLIKQLIIVGMYMRFISTTLFITTLLIIGTSNASASVILDFDTASYTGHNQIVQNGFELNENDVRYGYRKT